MLSILIVSDLTYASDEAIRGAASLGMHARAMLHVVHFAGQVTPPAREVEVRREGTMLRGAADALEDQLRRSLPAASSTPRRRIELGVPHDAILDHARTVDADLLVVPPQPIWPADTRRFGPVLRHLVAEATLPILVVRGPVRWPARHILVSVDRRDLELGTLERVCTWLHGAGCAGLDVQPTELEVLHVSDGVRAWRDVAPRLALEVRAAEELAWRLGARVRRRVRWGAVPARRIVEMAGYTGTDLVVMCPKSPHAGAGTWEWVVRRSPSNVLLVPEPPAGLGRPPEGTAERPFPRMAGGGEAPGPRRARTGSQTKPPGPHPVTITPQGRGAFDAGPSDMEESMLVELRERLGSELERLAQELTIPVAAGPGAEVAVSVRQPMGEREREIQLRVRRLGQFVAGLAKLDPMTLSYDRAGFGSSVVLQNLDTKERVSYTLVTGEVIDLDEDQVSLASPIGQALLGRKAGDRITVGTPQGMKRFRIVSVETLPQVFGIGGVPVAAAGAP